jgi:hydroxymethylbilane synthase
VSSPKQPKHLRLGTRASALALWQAHYVRDRLLAAHNHDGIERLTVELVEVTTEGDRILDRPLNQVGGKGLFVKGIEELLLRGEVDLAVHSMKDLPGHTPAGLALVCTPPRADPRDALVGAAGLTLASLPAGTRLGTSSLRRGALAKRLNPGLEIVSIRGNVQTRLGKIDEGSVDCVLLAVAGLERLGLGDRVAEHLDPDAFLPAACQGILAIETRAEDAELIALLAPLDHADTAIVAAAERGFLQELQGGCQVPMACYAELDGEHLRVRGLVVDPSGAPLHEAEAEGPREDADALGRAVARALLAQGAAAILDRFGRVR